MTRLLSACVHLGALLLAIRPAAAQVLIPGDGPARSECYGEWLSAAPNRGKTSIDCQDGDPSCDLDGVANGSCAVSVGVCLHLDNVPRCTPRAVQRVTVRATPRQIAKGLPVALPAPPPVPVTTATCGRDAIVTLPLRRKRSGRDTPSKRVTLRLEVTVRGTPGKDQDRLRLRCVPNAGAGRCTANPSGGPAELHLISAGAGTDLDLGWTGNAHSAAIAANAALRVCLAGCDAVTNPACTAREIETTVRNGTAFGAPSPLLVGGVPVCMVNRLGAPPLAGLTADLATGAMAGTLTLLSEFYRTSLTDVCPRCSGAAPGEAGVCDSGARQDRGCITADVVQVPAAGGDTSYAVSPDCPPAGQAVGVATLAIPVTTGVAALAGPLPCGAAQDDACGGACGAACTGSACVARIDGQCVSAQGGLSQLCCAGDTQRSCFGTATGAPIVRLGSATAPTSPFGDPTYPKAAGVTLAGAFCIPSSGSTLVDALVGLPGPGALVLPMATVWLP